MLVILTVLAVRYLKEVRVLLEVPQGAGGMFFPLRLAAIALPLTLGGLVVGNPHLTNAEKKQNHIISDQKSQEARYQCPSFTQGKRI